MVIASTALNEAAPALDKTTEAEVEDKRAPLPLMAVVDVDNISTAPFIPAEMITSPPS
jgi:hypothetical protein